MALLLRRLIINHWTWIALISLVFCFLTPISFYTIEKLGKNIPQNYMPRDYVTGLIGAVFFLFMTLFISGSRMEKNNYLALWIVKSIVTLGIMLFYEHQYGLDAYYYFEEGAKGSPLWIPEIGQGTSNIILLTNILYKITFLFSPSYHFAKISYSFFGFIGIVLIYKTLKMISKQYISPAWIFIIGFFPGVLFWTSILGKDPIIFTLTAGYAYSISKLIQKRNPVNAIFLAFILLLAISYVRIWMGIILLAPTALLFILFLHNWYLKSLLIPISFACFIFLYEQFSEKFKVDSMTDFVASANTLSKNWNHGGSQTEVPEFLSATDIALFVPTSIITALYRPFPGEVKSLFGWFASIDGLLYLILTLLVMPKFLKSTYKDRTVFWLASTLLLWASIYGFISAQNLGSGIRFRVQIAPIFLLFLFYHFTQSKNWIKNKLPNQT